MLVPYPNFVGPTYTSQARQAAAERCMNLYPEPIGLETQSGKLPLVYYGAPGLKQICDAGYTPGRGLYFEQASGRRFAVISTTLYEFSPAGVLTPRGFIGGDGPVSMASNGRQLAIATGLTLHIFDLGDFSLHDMSMDVQATFVIFLDGYFIALNPGMQRFQISGPYDGMSWNPLDFASVEGTPARALALIADHREAWFWSQDHGEVFYDSGNADFPIQRIDGAFIEQGIVATRSVCQFDNALVWLGASPRGGAIAWRSEGYAARRISTYAVEWAWSQYPTAADAVGYSYVEKGHTFWVLNFPAGNATWVYDAGTRMWHERSGYDQVHGLYTMHPGQYHLWDGSKHYVCGRQSGKIYEQSILYRDNAGEPLRWFRSAPHLYNKGTMAFYNSLLLDMQLGQGLASGQGSDPQLWLRISNDGGMTWGPEHWRGCGKQADYVRRVRWTQLGCARDRCFMVGGSDPIDLCLLGAYIDVQEGTA